MKFAAAVMIAALVGAAAAHPHGECDASKSKHRHHHHHKTATATGASTLSEIAAPTSIAASSSASAAPASKAVSSGIPTAIVNVGPPAAHSHSFSFGRSHTFSASHTRSTVLVTSTITASSVTATETLSASSDSSSALTSTHTVAPTTHTTTSSVKSTTTSVKPTTSTAKPTTTSVKPTTTSVKPTTTSTSSAAAPTHTAPASSNSKRGLGFNYATDTTPFAGAVSWAYSWGSSHSGALPAGVEFVPMLWSTDADHTNVWAADVEKALAAGATHLLGFNEPDLGAQSNLSPAEAAAGWKKYMEPYAGKARLVSPAVTNGGAPMGLAWMDAFLEACTDCHIDAIAIHIYDAASNAAYFKSYISGVASKYNKPTWITEFGASGTTGAQESFLGTMLPFLDGLEGVERYSYFGDFQGTLVQGNALTDLGKAYANTN